MKANFIKDLVISFILGFLCWIALIAFCSCDCNQVPADSYTKQEIDVRLKAMSDSLGQRIDEIPVQVSTDTLIIIHNYSDSIFIEVYRLAERVDSLSQSQGNFDQELYEMQGKFDRWVDDLSGKLDSLCSIIDSLLTDFPVDTTLLIGDSLRVSWIPSTSNDVSYYLVYTASDESMIFKRKIWHGSGVVLGDSLTTGLFLSTGIDKGVSYIGVTAKDSALNESGFSKVVKVKK